MNNYFETEFSGATVKIEENIVIKTEKIDLDVEFCNSGRKKPVSTNLHCVKCHAELEASGFMRNIDDFLLTFMCYECFDGSVPLSRVGSKALLKSKRQKEIKKFKCEECDISFRGIRSFKYHVKNNHENNQEKITKDFICQECNRSFSTEKRLNSHQENKHKKNNYFCGQCNRGFIMERFFKNHVERAHNKIFICGDCDRVFNDKERMKYHIQRIHMTMRYPCEDCNHSFTKISSLKSHATLRHSKVIEPFVCQHCGHSFIDQPSLTLHEDRVHRKDWTYLCVECDKTFPYEYNLAMHVNAFHRRLATNQHV